MAATSVADNLFTGANAVSNTVSTVVANTVAKKLAWREEYGEQYVALETRSTMEGKANDSTGQSRVKPALSSQHKKAHVTKHETPEPARVRDGTPTLIRSWCSCSSTY